MFRLHLVRLCLVVSLFVLVGALGACGIGVVVCKRGADCPVGSRCTDNRCQKPSSDSNKPPIARATGDVRVKQGARARLDGSTSSDADLDSLSFFWMFTKKPEGSKAGIDSGDAAQASFVADRPGMYVIKLTVKDPLGAADEDEFVVRANFPPVANAGGDQLVLPGATVTLNGGESRDEDTQDKLTFSWRMVKKPPVSAAVIADGKKAVTTFSADVAGLYILQLEVSDGFDSSSDTLSVNVADPKTITPSLQRLDPWRAPTRSIVNLTLHGENFIQGAKVFFDETPVPATYRSSKRFTITLNLSQTSVGGHRFKVENPGGKQTEALLFQVDDVPTPTLSSITPQSGTSGQSVKIEANGKGFVFGARLFFQDRALSTKYLDTNRLEASLPLAGLKAGDYPVYVENDKNKRSNTKLFTVHVIPPQPRILRYEFAPQNVAHVGLDFEYLRFYATGLTPSTQLFIDGKRYTGKVEVKPLSPNSSTGYLYAQGFSSKSLSAGYHSFVLKNTSPGHTIESSPYRIRFTDPKVPSVSYLRFDGVSSSGATEREYKTLEIVGRNFTSKMDLYFDDKRYTGKFERIGETRIVIRPYSTKGQQEGRHSFYVYNYVDGKKRKSNTISYTLQNGLVPTIQRVYSSDNTGTLYTGRVYTFLRIYGTNFAPSFRVLFDGVPYTGTVQLDQDRTIFMYQFDARKLQPGSHTFQVRNTIDGKNYDSRIKIVSFLDGYAPVIRSLSFTPSSQIYPGEIYQARISVQNAKPGAKVLVDGREYTGSVQSSSTLITLPQFDTTGLIIGTHTIHVRNVIDGNNYDSAPRNFYVRKRQPPRITSITPPSITTKAATTIQVSGSYFAASSRLFIGNQEVQASSIQTYRLTALIDPSKFTAGRHEVKVVNSDGQQSNIFAIYILPDVPPTIWRTTPSELHFSADPTTAATSLTLYGFNITTGATISLDGKTIGSISRGTTTSSYARGSLFPNALSKAGTWKIKVRNPDGKESNAIEIEVLGGDKPEIFRASPNILTPTRSRTMVVYGRGFSANSTLLWNGQPHTASYLASPNAQYAGRFSVTLTTTELANAPALSKIEVKNPDGTVSAAHTVIVSSSTSILTLSYVSPTQIVAGYPLTSNLQIRGRGFTPNTKVFLNGKTVPATYQGTSYMTLPFDPSNAKPGEYLVFHVEDGNQISNTMSAYAIRGPFITQIDPPVLQVSQAGGLQTLTIRGSYFAPGATLELFGKSFPMSSSSTLTLPLQSELANVKAGLHSLSIKYPGGQRSQTAAIYVAPSSP